MIGNFQYNSNTTYFIAEKSAFLSQPTCNWLFQMVPKLSLLIGYGKQRFQIADLVVPATFLHTQLIILILPHPTRTLWGSGRLRQGCRNVCSWIAASRTLPAHCGDLVRLRQGCRNVCSWIAASRTLLQPVRLVYRTQNCVPQACRMLAACLPHTSPFRMGALFPTF